MRDDPSKLSDRAKWGLILKPEVKRVFEKNYEVYGYAKLGDKYSVRVLTLHAALSHG